MPRKILHDHFCATLYNVGQSTTARMGGHAGTAVNFLYQKSGPIML